MGLFSVLPIVIAHYRSLVSDSSRLRVMAIFFIIPIAVSVFLVGLGIEVSRLFVQVVVSALAVLIGFSINAMLLLIRQAKGETSDREAKLVKNTRNHTMYSTIVGLGFLAIALLFFFPFPIKIVGSEYLSTIGSVFLYFGIIHYLLTLYLLPARLYAIAENIQL